MSDNVQAIDVITSVDVPITCRAHSEMSVPISISPSIRHDTGNGFSKHAAAGTFQHRSRLCILCVNIHASSRSRSRFNRLARAIIHGLRATVLHGIGLIGPAAGELCVRMVDTRCTRCCCDGGVEL